MRCFNPETWVNKLSSQTACPRRFRFVAVSLALWLGFAPLAVMAGQIQAKPTPTSSDDSADGIPSNYPELVIGPGDLLDIHVYGENGSAVSSLEGGGGGTDALPTDYQVDSDGVIVFPFLGRVHLTGKTPAQASDLLARMLNKPRKVTVLIKESNTYWVSVLGDVAKPGRYQIVGQPTLLSALAEAGGPLPDSDLGGTILLHDDFKTKLNLNRYFNGEGKVDTEPYLYPGDTLMIQKSGWPTIGEIAIVASILASAAVITVELTNLRH